jgi:hypothetical protein
MRSIYEFELMEISLVFQGDFLHTSFLFLQIAKKRMFMETGFREMDNHLHFIIQNPP